MFKYLSKLRGHVILYSTCVLNHIGHKIDIEIEHWRARRHLIHINAQTTQRDTNGTPMKSSGIVYVML